MVGPLDKWLKPAEYFRKVHTSLVFDFDAVYRDINETLKEFDGIIKEIKHELQELRTLEEKSDKNLLFGLMSYWGGYHFLVYSKDNLERIIAHRLFVETRWHLNNPELDPDVRKKLEVILEKTRELEEDENIKKAFETYDMIPSLLRDSTKRFRKKLIGRLVMKIRKEVGRYDIDAFLIKQMLEHE
jgi:hypothetical protein